MATADLFANATDINSIVQALTTLANASDVYFLVVMGVLVFMMQWGFAMLEGGQVRKKNVNNVMMTDGVI